MNSIASNFLALRRFRALVTETGQSFWALADQAVVSAGTFATGIVVARHLVPRDYGIYALLIGVLLSVNALQAAVIGYPLMVRGAATDEMVFRRIVLTALLMGSVFSLVVSVAVALGVLRIENSAGLMVTVAFSLFAAQLQQGTRNALLARQRYRATFPGDLLSYGGQAVIIWTVLQGIDSSPALLFGIIGLTSLAGCALQIAKLRLHLQRFHFDRCLPGEFWLLGRWMLLISITGTFTLQLFSWGLTISQGSAEFAKYQAVINIIGVTHPVLLSLSNFIIPAVAIANASGGSRFALGKAFQRSLPGAVLMVPILLALILYGDRVLTLLYGASSPYGTLTVALRWFVIAYTFQLLGTVLAAFLNGTERPRSTLAMNITGALVAGAVGLPLTLHIGVNGAASGFAIVCFARTIVASVLVYRAMRVGDDGSRESATKASAAENLEAN
jgi:O-antigen/teichoic acid export membrane protein